MYAMMLVRYRAAAEEMEKVTEAHRDYLRQLQEQGTVLASGPMIPRSGGMILVRVPDENAAEALDKLRDNDPFYLKGVANYELVAWHVASGKEGLDKL